MRTKSTLAVALALCPALLFAAQPSKSPPGDDVSVPSIDKNAGKAGQGDHPPKVDPISNDAIKLLPKESEGITLSKKWMTQAEMPAPGEDGSVQFLFGATIPTIVCAPLHVCDLALQAGEVLNDLDLGDKVRWQVKPALSGSPSGEKITHLRIKPRDAGLETNMAVSTDRRNYTVKLVSAREDWMPLASFTYPDDIEQEMKAYRQAVVQTKKETVLPTGQNLAELDFNYSLSGDSPSWKPIRVYSNGVKTYIKFPESMQPRSAPALVALSSDDDDQTVPYRQKGLTYVVDKVLDRAALVMGVGSGEQRVFITHDDGGKSK